MDTTCRRDAASKRAETRLKTRAYGIPNGNLKLFKYILILKNGKYCRLVSVSLKKNTFLLETWSSSWWEPRLGLLNYWYQL